MEHPFIVEFHQNVVNGKVELEWFEVSMRQHDGTYNRIFTLNEGDWADFQRVVANTNARRGEAAQT